MRDYLSSKEQETLHILGAIVGTLDQIISDLEHAGKSARWLKCAKTYTLKHADDMVLNLSDKCRQEYLDKLNRREIIVVDRQRGA